ncbi:MAG: hypothetical protein ABW075_05995 [Aeromicrobium sp.]
MTRADAPRPGPVRSWSGGIDRVAQRIFAILALGELALLVLHVRGWRDGAGHVGTVISGTVGVIVLLVAWRAWQCRAGRADLVLINAALVLSLVLNGTWSTSGAAADAAPAFIVFVLALALPCLVGHRWGTVVIPGVTTIVIYLVGRRMGGEGDAMIVSLDEVLTVGPSCLTVWLIARALRSAAGAADVAHEAALVAAGATARAEAEQLAVTEARRVLHDDVIAALVAVELTGCATSSDRLRDACRRAAAALDLSLVGPDDSASGHGLIRRLERELDLDLRIDIAVGLDLAAVPTEVLAAMVDASAEALRNVHRHSGCDSAVVRIGHLVGRGVSIEVVDEGRGLGSASPGFGVTHSIRERVADVGGTTTITSSSAGTTVTLGWTPTADPADTGGLDTGGYDAAYALIRRGGGGTRSFTLALATVYSVGQVWLALRYVPRGDHVVASTILAAVGVALGYVIALRTASRPTTLSVQAGFAVAQYVLLATGLWLAGPGALAGFESWIVGLTTLGFILVALVTPPWPAVGFAAGASVIVGLAAWLDPTIAVSAVIAPIVQPVFHTTIAVLAAIAVRRVGRARQDDQLATVGLLARQAMIAARQRIFDVDLAHLVSSVTPFLRAVARGELDPASSEVHDRARALAAEARDDLYLTGLLHEDTRAFLRELRSRGVRVVIRSGGEVATSAEIVNTLIGSIGADAGSEVVATLSLPTAETRYSRLVVIGDVDRGHMLASAQLIGGRLESESGTHILTVDHDAELGPHK